MKIVEGVAGVKEGLICKARDLKTMLSSCRCCISFYVEWFSLVSHHHLCFVLLSSAFNSCVVWCLLLLLFLLLFVVIPILCCYSSHIHIRAC
jgi:hypothetical protein